MDFARIGTDGDQCCDGLIEKIAGLVYLAMTSQCNRITTKFGNFQELKNILSNNQTKIRLFDGKDEFKSQFDTLIATFFVSKKKKADIELIYNQFTDNTETISVNSLNDIWIHGNQIVSRIFRFFNQKTISYPKIFDRLYKNLKKSNKVFIYNLKNLI